MTRCLEDRTLFLLTEGEASGEERSHLQSCEACAQRYDAMQRDLRLLTRTLAQEPPSVRLAKTRAPIFYKSLPIAAGVLLVVALMWGESRLWRPDSSSEQTLNGDVSQFLEQIAEAIDGGTMKEVGSVSSDADLASVQVALGENCSDDCQGLFDNAFATKTQSKSTDRSLVTAGRRALDPAMQRIVSERAE